MFVVAIAVSGVWAKALWFNLAVVAFTVGGAELYFYEVYFNNHAKFGARSFNEKNIRLNR